LSTTQAGGRGHEGYCTIYYLSCLDCIFLCDFVVNYAFEESPFFQIFTLNQSRCRVLCASCKKVPHTSLQCIFWSFGIIDSNTFGWWKLSTAKDGARGLAMGCCTFSLSLMYRLNQTSLQFSCNFVEISASEGSPFSEIFILYNSRCQFPCGSCKSCPVLHFSVVIFFWSFEIVDFNTFKCLKLSTALDVGTGLN
jgi:hypothetical protein